MPSACDQSLLPDGQLGAVRGVATEPDARSAVEAAIAVSNARRSASVSLAMLALLGFGNGCAERVSRAMSASPVAARMVVGAMAPVRAASLLAGADTVTPDPGTLRAGETWGVPGALLRIRVATAAADGEGAWRVRIVAEIVGTSHVPVAVEDQRIVLVGATEVVDRPGPHSIQVRAGETMRREFAWRLFADERPVTAQLVWEGADPASAPPVRSVSLTTAPPIPAWTRTLNSSRPPLRVTVTGVDEISPPYLQLSVRVWLTLSNTGEEPIEFTRSSFTVRVQNPRDEALTAASATAGYNPSLISCQTAATMLPEQHTLRPGERLTGAICFMRTTRDHASFVRVSVQRDEHVDFSGFYPVAG